MCGSSRGTRGNADTRWMAAMWSAISAIGGRHDLGAVAGVDLVAVVGGRVVAGGDHDPRGRTDGDRPKASTGVGTVPSARRTSRPVAAMTAGRVLGELLPSRGGRRGRSPPVRPPIARRATGPARRPPGAPRPGSCGWARRRAAPRSPAVPNDSDAPNRSCRPSSSSEREQRLELGNGDRIGVVVAPRLDPGPQGSAPITARRSHRR